MGHEKRACASRATSRDILLQRRRRRDFLALSAPPIILVSVGHIVRVELAGTGFSFRSGHILLKIKTADEPPLRRVSVLCSTVAGVTGKSGSNFPSESPAFAFEGPGFRRFRIGTCVRFDFLRAVAQWLRNGWEVSWRLPLTLLFDQNHLQNCRGRHSRCARRRCGIAESKQGPIRIRRSEPSSRAWNRHPISLPYQKSLSASAACQAIPILHIN